MTSAPRSFDVADLSDALTDLSVTHPDLTAALSRTVGVIVQEAQRNARFARALTQVLMQPGDDAASVPTTRRTGRRTPGVLDPFAVYADGGEDLLRARLSELDLERLRDIVAEHAMDHDRLAMKWKNPNRVIDRILDKVQTRSAKGAVFR